jgi:hypothetical protein
MPAAVGTDVVEWRGGLATAKLLSIHGRLLLLLLLLLLDRTGTDI